MQFNGTYTALITPFLDDALDEEGLRQNIRYQLLHQVNGIVPLGTTGESSALTEKERDRVIKICVEEAKGKVPIIVGTGHNVTAKAIEITRRAYQLGADVALIVAPYYNKPTQEGIMHHYASIAKSVDIPILVYNVPGRTGVNIEVSTMLKLAEYPNIVGVKEASGSVAQAGDIINMLRHKRPDFAVLSGDDALTIPMMAIGACGVVSVLSNLVPALMVDLVNAGLRKDMTLATTKHHELLPLMKAIFIESNPIPIKAAMQLLGRAAGKCRLPLCSLSPENHTYIEQMLHKMNII